MAEFVNSWSDLLPLIDQSVRQVWAQPAPILLALLVPVLCALVSRSLIALIISALLAAIAFVAIRASIDETHQWTVALMICLAGVLTAVQAAWFRRTRGQLRRASFDLKSFREELGEIRDKYEKEVKWRRAAENVAASKGSKAQ
jgi:peptidoglycan/LPS O-acetylase OafA/YrhL